MSKLHTPFRYDYVGSFLRPERLKKARADYESGKINKAELTADRKSTRLNSSHPLSSRMPSSA